MNNFSKHLVLTSLILFAANPLSATLAEDSASMFIEFDDNPLDQDIVLPDWFKLSFLELNSDIEDVNQNGKRGLIVYFGQKDCPYCKTHLEKNWHDRGIVTYTRKYFDVVAIDVRGDRPVADTKGKIYKKEKEFSVALNTDFTPTLIFYNLRGEEVLRLSGYHPPYQFRAALEYVADAHYKKENLRSYLARAETLTGFEERELNSHEVFSPPPYAFDRRHFQATMPLVVFFEQATCHACDVLHAGPMQDNDIVPLLSKMEVAQLDMQSETPVLTPDGRRSTAKQWAERLGLYYAPTIIFFDEAGEEIIRIDSVIRFYRLKNVLDYVLTKGYQEFPNFQQWRQRYNK
ncbi:thioredoxin family protein [Kaarinaea lacus]